MTPKLSHDIQQLVAETSHGAAQVSGNDGRTYWVLTEEAMQIRQYVQQGVDEADCGKVAPWDSNEIKAAGRALRKQRGV